MGINQPFIILNEGSDESQLTVRDCLEFLKSLKIDDLKKVNEARIEGGFEYNGDFFSFSKDKDQGNFTQQTSIISFKKTMNVDTTQELIEWKTENNGVKYFTEDEFFPICLASEQHKRNHIKHFWVFAQEIMNTQYTSLKEISNITLPKLETIVTLDLKGMGI
jgi:hypothetical protein